MDKLKNINWVMIFSLLLWCAITLIRVMHHSPWYDEAHAWLISQELSFAEILREMKIEGHTFLWYLFLMPFAKSNFMYPYSMLLLNWLFCFIAVLILWLKAPFNNWIKFLISFSFPFLVVYSVLARCYAIGIMFLFILASMDKVKLSHPNWYALFLILCANTSVMAIVGATVFGIIFIYELIKNKKNILIPFIIMGVGVLLILFQLSGSDTTAHIEMPMNINFFANLIFPNIYINLVLITITGIILAFFYIKNKILPIFLILSYSMLFGVNCIFMGTIWNHFFYYIYFIISCWLLVNKHTVLKCKYITDLLLVIISFFLIFFRANNYFYSHILDNDSKQISSFILNDKNIAGSNVIFYDFSGYELYPYLKFSNINILNYCSSKKFDYNSLSFYHSEVCGTSDMNMYADFYEDYLLKLANGKKNFLIGAQKLNSNVGNFLKLYSYRNLGDKIYIYFIQKNI